MKVAKVLLFAILCGTTTTAFAGVTQSFPVIFTSNGFEGSFGSVRNSADSNQYLTCEINSYASNGSRWAYCSAHDSNTFTAARGCYVNDAVGLDNVQALGDGDHLRLSYDPATARCTWIGITKSSRHEPRR